MIIETERGLISPWLDAFTSIWTALIRASLMLVPDVKGNRKFVLMELSELLDRRIRCSHTSIRFDALDVFLGICDLNGGARYQLLTPTTHIVVEVNDAELIIYGQVIQNSLHGLYCLWEKFGIKCNLQNDHTVAMFHNWAMKNEQGAGKQLENCTKRKQLWLTCFILTPHMDPLTSITNTMFLGRGERFDGAKNWTKWPSDTWRRQPSGRLSGTQLFLAIS